MNPLVLFAGLLAVAAQPKAIIDGPVSARVGDLIVLNAESSENAAHYCWAVIPEATEGLLWLDNGRRAVFANHAPGTYTFILAVGNDSGEQDIDLHRIVIGTAHVEEITTSHVGASQARLRREDVPGLSVQALSSIETADLASEAAVVASAFRRAAAMVETGNVASSAELVKATSALAREGLLDSWSAWTPWFVTVGTALDEIKVGGELADLDAYQRVWEDIAEALEG